MSRLDRRALFTSGAAAALLAASGVSLDAAPRSGGRLRLAVPRADARFDLAVRGAVFDTLTEVGPDGLLREELATSWESDEPGREWVLHMRQDVQFHDGTALSAEHVARSLAYHGFAPQAEVLSDNRLRLVLATPDPQLPYRLADPTLVVQKLAASAEAPIGTGPYRVRQFRAGRHFVGERVRPHFKDGQAAWFDEVEIAVIPDPAVRAEALRDGFVDVADLPLGSALGEATGMTLHPDAANVHLAARHGVGVPAQVGRRAPLDDGRIAQRWWIS